MTVILLSQAEQKGDEIVSDSKSLKSENPKKPGDVSPCPEECLLCQMNWTFRLSMEDEELDGDFRQARYNAG